MIISALDKDTVKLLSTTQIITSVSNAVKELTENALDANATSIEINLIDNGSSMIEVKDNAWGISKEDTPYMALPSYTSKISSFSDLETLHTYGFRGEALCALCAVADVTIVTKTEHDEAAMSYIMDHNGQILKSESCHRATGTTVQVKQLFKDIPVRRQIITNVKKAKQEIKAVESLVKSYGICKFLVRINCRVDKNVIFAKPSMNSMKEAMTCVLGKAVTTKMTLIEVEEPEINMRLMIPSKDAGNVPEIFQTGAQYIFANERPVKHKELEKVMTKTIAVGLGTDSSSKKKAVFVLHLTLDSSNIDVNLDPNKFSIMFKQQQIVLDILDKNLRNFYGIELVEAPKEDAHDTSTYQDYTHTAGETESENVRPACKKRKLEVESLATVESIAAEENRNNTKANVPEVVQTINDGQSDRNPPNDFSNDMEILTSQLIPPDLSESDSNDTEDFIAISGKHGQPVNTAIKEPNKNSDDSPPFESTPNTAAPASISTQNDFPYVDADGNFDWKKISKKLDEKENRAGNLNIEAEIKRGPQKNATLQAWSKGHVAGLKGGTDVQPYVSSDDARPLTIKPASMDGSFHKSNTLNGFVLFSRHVRSTITKQNPAFSAALIAQKISEHWKELSPEERGYYKDLAREKRLEHEEEKRAKKVATNSDSEKNKNRLLKMLENMKKLNVDKKENLVQRTTVTWEINLQKITGCRLDKTSWGSTKVLIGPVAHSLWTAQTSGYIWMFDVTHLQKELNICDLSIGQNDAENVERVLRRWLSGTDDLSSLHPVYPLLNNSNT